MSSTHAFVRTVATGDLQRPFGLAFDDPRDRLLIADGAGHHVAHFDATASSPTTETIGSYGTDSSTEGLSVPMDVAVDGDGNLVVLDAGNVELDRYSYDAAADAYGYDGGFLGGTRGTFAGTELADPTALTWRGGDWYVLDAGNDRVVRVDGASGSASEAVTGGSWGDASGIAVDGAGTVYVSDRSGDVVTVHGGSSGPLGGTGSRDGEFRDPVGLAVDASDHLYVVDDGNRRVQEFDASGAHAESFGRSGQFGAGHGIAVGGGSAYVADVSRGAVHEYAAAGGPSARVEESTLDFGAVEVGYTLRAAVTVHNDGGAPLSVTNVTATGDGFDARTASATVPPGDSERVEVAFGPTDVAVSSGELRIDHDGPGSAASVVLLGRGVEPTPVEAGLVLDRSGSMRQPAGGQSKMAALQRAADTFVDLLRAGVGDELTVVGFDDSAAVVHPLEAVTESPRNTRRAAKRAIRSLSPGGTTSIGDGVVTARSEFGSDGDDVRRVLVVVSDGMENEPPYVLPADEQRGVDLSTLSGFAVHTVGLGLGSEVDLPVLSKLAGQSADEEAPEDGSFHLTEERWLRLQKFFLEILADAIGEYVAVDPTYDVDAGDGVDVAATLGEVDHAATFAAYWDDPQASVDVGLRAPDGTLVDPTFAGSAAGVRQGGTATSQFYRVDLPLAAAGGAHAGDWALVVRNRSSPGRQITAGVSVIVDSDLGVDCSVHRDADATGNPARLDLELTEEGAAVAPDAVDVAVERPVHSRGELYADLLAGEGVDDGDGPDDGVGDGSNPDGSVVGDERVDRTAFSESLEALDAADDASADAAVRLYDAAFDRLDPDRDPSEDYAADGIRGELAEAVRRDPRFRERTTTRPDVEAGEGAETPVSAHLDPLRAEGAYDVHAVVEYERQGRTLTRECRATLAAVSRPSPARTTAEVVDERSVGDAESLRVRVTPRDQVDNLLGPALADEVSVAVDAGSAGEVVDRGDGSYRFRVDVPAEAARAGAAFERVDDVGRERAEALRSAGFETLADVLAADSDRLESVAGVGTGLAERLRQSAAGGAGSPTVSVSLREATLSWTLPELRAGVGRREPTGPQRTPNGARER
ncbi:VWA domain-containing protein [Halomicrobium urmianum]|uniref:VWA domain-containing protein n=1 Tax=Halomicrobium urmianum TaxID=1586233 RepID=UPI001CDA2A54|nr:VWA domain-containing protein [Halomicrobium urmianum]